VLPDYANHRHLLYLVAFHAVVRAIVARHLWRFSLVFLFFLLAPYSLASLYPIVTVEADPIPLIFIL